MGARQRRQRPREREVAQHGHVVPGTDARAAARAARRAACPPTGARGRRWMQTLAKLPTIEAEDERAPFPERRLRSGGRNRSPVIRSPGDLRRSRAGAVKERRYHAARMPDAQSPSSRPALRAAGDSPPRGGPARRLTDPSRPDRPRRGRGGRASSWPRCSGHDGRPLRAAGGGPLRRLPIRARHGRGPSVPVQRGRAALHRLDQPAATRRWLAAAHAAGLRGEWLVALRDRHGRGAVRRQRVARCPGVGRAAGRRARRRCWREPSSRWAAPWSGGSSTAPTSRCSCSCACGCSIGWCGVADRRGRRRGRRREPGRAGPSRGPAARDRSRRGLDARPAGERPRRALAWVPGRGRPRGARPACASSPGSGSAARWRTSRCSRTTECWRRPAWWPNTPSTCSAACSSASIPPQAPVGFAGAGRPSISRRSACCSSWPRSSASRAPERRAARWWTGAVAVVALALSPNLFLGVHFNRYLLWAVPGLLVLAAAGLGVVGAPARRRGRGAASAACSARARRCSCRPGRALDRCASRSLYGDMAGDVYRRDVATARVDHVHTFRRGVRLANLATSVEYLTGHRNLNLHGVTSPAFFGGRPTERDAGVLEGLARLPAAERPPYLIATRSAVEGSPALGALVEGPPLFQTATGGDEIEIYRLRYDLVGRNAAPFLATTAQAVAGRREVDRAQRRRSRATRPRTATVCAIAARRLPPRRRRPGRPTIASGVRVADAGRAILGGESFEIRTMPGRTWCWCCARLRLDAGGAGPCRRRPRRGDRVRRGRPDRHRKRADGGDGAAAGGKRMGRVGPAVPAALVASDRTRIGIAGRFASFHYWAYQ